MKLGLLTACLPGESLTDIAAWAGDHGYAGLEVAVWPDEPGRDWEASHIDVAHLDDAGVESVRKLFATHQLATSALAYYENCLDVDPTRRGHVHQHLRHVIDAAPRLGVDVV